MVKIIFVEKYIFIAISFLTQYRNIFLLQYRNIVRQNVVCELKDSDLKSDKGAAIILYL